MIRALKHAAKSLLLRFTLPIRGGPLKGKKWIAATGSKFLKGTYEPFKTTAFAKSLRAGDVVYDVGAHVGYFAAVASTIVGPEGQVFAFEPRPLNIRCLKHHLHINGLSNVRLFEACVGNQAGPCRFDTHTGTGTGHVSQQGDIEVQMVRLDDFVAENDLPQPNVLKIDVEGGEEGVLRGARQFVQQARPIILVATHGDSEHTFVTEFLTSFNYEYSVLDHQGSKGDTEILALPKEPPKDG